MRPASLPLSRITWRSLHGVRHGRVIMWMDSRNAWLCRADATKYPYAPAGMAYVSPQDIIKSYNN